MTMQYIRDYYVVPAKRGAKILFQGKSGTVIGSRDQYLRVRIIGEKSIVTLHPTWDVEYID